jgi:tetratricopeptide (TPR) repeat protein
MIYSVSFNKIGDVQLQLGDTEKALQAYQQALEIHQTLPRIRSLAMPSNARFFGEFQQSWRHAVAIG